MKVEEIAPTDQVALSQAGSIATLVTFARAFTDPLSRNAANNGLKELLKTADVSQRRNRVVITATLSPSLLTGLVQGESSAQNSEAGSSLPPAK